MGSYLAGVSIYGALDLAGNVWEWVSSLNKSYPYLVGDGREDPSSREGRVLRGGSWNNRALNQRASNRSWGDPEFRDTNLGFRCAR